MQGERKGVTYQKQEMEYRKLPSLNVSSIKVFAKEGPRAFYKQIIEGITSKKQEELEESKSIIIGSVFDFLRTDCDGDLEVFNNTYDERFQLFNGIKSDIQEFLLADELFRITKACRDENGVITIPFEDRFSEAFRIMQEKEKFKGKTEQKGYELFCAEPSEDKKAKNPNLTSAKFYFDEKMKAIDKQTVDLYMLECAKRLNEQATTDPFVRDIFFSQHELKNKLVIEWIYTDEFDNVIPCKVEIDLALWDYENKIVYPKDIKTIYDNRKEDIRRRYYNMRYGWQGAFYTRALEWFLKMNDMEGWTVGNFEFIFFSTGPVTRPVRLEMTDEMYQEALLGGSFNGREDKGLLKYLEEIGWHERIGSYDCEKEVFENNGKITF